MTTGVLPFEELRTKVTMNTGFFETSQYTENTQMVVCSGNHDKAGLSIGLLQYNFGDADRAQEWFKFMIDNHITIVNSAFGANTTQRDSFINAINTMTRADRIIWANGITDFVIGDGKGRGLIQPYKDAFATMLLSAEGKTKYYAMRDVYYWNLPFDLFRQLSCKSRLALASLFDLYVNKGRYYPINCIQTDFDAIDANEAIDEIEKERQKIYQINFRGNEEENSLNDASSAAFDDRRSCFWNQGGDYFGSAYDPIQFDMNQEPALDEKTGKAPINVNLGSVDVTNIFIGENLVEKIYLGAELIGGGSAEPYTTAKVPQTQIRTNGGSWQGIGAVTQINLTAGQPFWIDVQNFVACRTYYTTDGSEPTENSNLYTGVLSFDTNVSLKIKSISIFGVAEATKILDVIVEVPAEAPVTTISPAEVNQNNIPLLISLSTSEVGATIYYKIGTNPTVNTYAGTFEVNQTTNGVYSHLIQITYWAVGANATEIEKSITYDTSGAIPEQPIVSVVNSPTQIALDWEPCLNTTSYTVFRSTVQGDIGAILAGAQYINPTVWMDTTAEAGITYYYTVQAGNYASGTNSAQVSGILAVEAPQQQAAYRYLKIEGYGSVEEPVTTRVIEFEAWEDTVNRMTAATILSNETVSLGVGGGTIASIKDGAKATTGYPLWWTVTPNANIIIDLLAERPLTKLNYYSYSILNTQRANRFKILGSNTNNGADWEILWDMSANTTPQPILPNGYEYIMPLPT